MDHQAGLPRQVNTVQLLCMSSSNAGSIQVEQIREHGSSNDAPENSLVGVDDIDFSLTSDPITQLPSG